jgi:hypothetical protein
VELDIFTTRTGALFNKLLLFPEEVQKNTIVRGQAKLNPLMKYMRFSRGYFAIGIIILTTKEAFFGEISIDVFAWTLTNGT